ncbi:YhgE/Pip domain-containing protein [Neobacillus sp.]|uniref:YhgE/Pip domain-containing protein n=1 Tax=Neobacillus sp. TaxID=2675273 RepID=UPI00289AF294|nr:YhgE/Pip domain-containing protein [Neobacillus sp.]
MKNILLKEELFTIFKNKKVLIPIIAVMFVPVLYAGMFLWAFWDPYDKLNELPVAVVNNDTGATLDGIHLKLGDDLVSNLKESKDFGYEFVDKNEGYKKLKDEKYYMVIEIPKDFSKNATTLLDEKPKKLELIYTPNESFNFLSAQIGGSAVEKIKTAVAEKVTETYAETMFTKISEVADGVVKASDGAGQLSDGSVDLNKGSKELNDGLSTLAKKSIEFDNGMKSAGTGANKLAAGSKDLKNGLAKADSNIPLLIAGTQEAFSGAEQLKRDLPAGIASEIGKQLNGSVGELNTGIDYFQSQLTATLSDQIAKQTIAEQTAKMKELASTLVANGVSPQLVNGIMTAEQQKAPTKEQLQQQISSELSPKLDAGFKQFKSGVNEKLSGAANGLEEKIKTQTNPYFDKLIGGIGTINNGQKTLQQGIHDLYVGSTQLTAGSQDLSAGMNQLSDGSNQLTGGAGQLAAGSDQLKDGTTKLSEGAKELADKLADGAKDASKVHSDEKTYNMMADPVKLDNEKINHVPNYGTGFAPYFLSLGLFVGALLLSIVFPLRDTAVVPSSGFNWFLSKFSIMAGVGIIQAIVADIILLAGLGLDVQSIPEFILFSVITSLTFIALIQLLVSVFADAGRFLAIIILIFQLTTSAGTFPLELIPNFLQHFNAFLPMTYSVQGFKAVISSGDFSFMWQNFMILLSFLLVFALGTIAYFTMKHKHQYKLQNNNLVNE